MINYFLKDNFKYFLKYTLSKSNNFSSLLNFLIKLISLLLSILSISIYNNFFDNVTLLGFWFTINALLNWIFSFDFGISNTLRNRLVVYIVNSDNLSSKREIRSSFRALFYISLVFLIVGTALIFLLDINYIFKVNTFDISSLHLKISIFVLYFSFISQLVFRLIYSVLYALQKSILPNLIHLISTLVILLFAVLLNMFNLIVQDKLFILSLLNLVTFNFPLILLTTVILKKYFNGVFSPLLGISSYSVIKIILQSGLFFFSQLLFILFISSNEILILLFFGNKFVVDFTFYNRFYSLIPTFITIFLTPYWSQITREKINKNFKWLRKTLNFFTFILVISVFFSLLVTAFMPLIQNIFSNMNFDTTLMNKESYFIFLIYNISLSSHILYSTFACGLNRLSSQIYTYLIGFLIKVPVILLSKLIFDSWLIILIVSIVFMILYSIIEYIKIRSFLLKQY